ncbi:MAG: hypothetical protein GOP50_00710 [Candidatus Heimdallarchaeota archaeon]|nr:hypothetical protein [Candidatus Heimdallarchaeota archaeon]
MKQNKMKMNAIAFTLIIISMSLVMALSTPVNSVLAVKLSDDDATNLSIQTLRNNIDNVIVVDYDTLEYSIYINRIIAPVIWVGHGNENGVTFEGEQISWNDFSRNILKTLNSDIMLSCHSSNLIEKTALTTSEVFTFNGIVDAVLGALIASMVCSQTVDVGDSLLNRLESIISNKDELTPLLIDGKGIGPIGLDPGDGGTMGYCYWVEPTPDIMVPILTDQYWAGKLSGAEAMWYIIQCMFLGVAIGIGEAAAGVTMWHPAFQTLSAYVSTLVLTRLFTILIYDCLGLISDEAALASAFGSSCMLGESYFNLMWFMIKGFMSWYNSRDPALKQNILSLIFISAILSLLLLIVSDGIAFFVRLGIYTISFAILIIGLVADFNDVDMIVG